VNLWWARQAGPPWKWGKFRWAELGRYLHTGLRGWSSWASRICGVELSQTWFSKLLKWSVVYRVEFVERSWFFRRALPNKPLEKWLGLIPFVSKRVTFWNCPKSNLLNFDQIYKEKYQYLWIKRIYYKNRLYESNDICFIINICNFLYIILIKLEKKLQTILK
jgi:hypothetical protein